jgi:hypothetical protein
METIEFSKYGKLQHIVRRIVDHDDEFLISSLYQHLDALFIPKFWKAVQTAREMSLYRHVVIGTHLQMHNTYTDEYQMHAVSVWFNKNGKGFMYDPNGDALDDWEFVGYKTHETIRRVFQIDSSRGSPPPYVDSPGYIHGGGYCEFYNLYKLKDIPTHVQDDSNIEQLARNPCTFPGIVQYSKDIVERVFGQTC